jgi:hypothetical protein
LEDLITYLANHEIWEELWGSNSTGVKRRKEAKPVSKDARRL